MKWFRVDKLIVVQAESAKHAAELVNAQHKSFRTRPDDPKEVQVGADGSLPFEAGTVDDVITP